jgi:hypothetical protein
MRPDGERRRHARQQRWVAKALSRFEEVHHLVLVAQFDRAAPDDEKSRRRRAILDQNVGACRIGPHRRRCGDTQQIIPGKLIKWGERGEEIGDLFHDANPGGSWRQRQERRTPQDVRVALCASLQLGFCPAVRYRSTFGT